MVSQIIQSPSPNFNDRRDGKTVQMLVLHYTGMKSAEVALERMCDPEAEVSAHYMADEEGRVFQLVSEEKRAWHAGLSSWRGETDINSCSIGIEIVNPGHEFGYLPFPEKQMAAVEALASDIVKRYTIEPANVVGHSDIAPVRKQDPGELFDWKRLADAGVGLWPVDAGEQQEISGDEFMQDLQEIGYDINDLDAAILAFQRRWLPDHMTGVSDLQTRNRAQTVKIALSS